MSKTVVILGAGAVRAHAGQRRSVSGTPPLDRDFFAIARKVFANQATRVSRQLHKVVGTYAEEVLASLEAATTLLYLKSLDAASRSPAHRAFVNQLELIERVLGQSTNRLGVGPRSLLYRLLRAELRNAGGPHNLTIVTFNYDLMVERVLDELQTHGHGEVFSMPECYHLPQGRTVVTVNSAPQFRHVRAGHDGIPVLKLHGSLNWHSIHRSKMPSPSALLRTNRELTVVNCPEIRYALSWTRRKRRVYLRPIILPPVTGKRGLMHRDLEPVWSSAAAALASAERLLIVGYSCPPLDFEAKVLLGESVQPTQLRELIIIDPDTAVASRFVPLCGLSSVHVYNSVQGYLT